VPATVSVKVIAMTRLARVGRFAPKDSDQRGCNADRGAIRRQRSIRSFTTFLPMLPDFASFPIGSWIGSTDKGN